jgi:Cd2+/Zn2+-exporting ATPase
MKNPYLFDEFFASGQSETVSPFLTSTSRRWGKNLSLKAAGSSACLLGIAFVCSFTNPLLTPPLLTLVYFLAGIPALIAAINDLKNLEINIDVLMTLAAFIALLIDSGLEGALLLVLFELSHGIEENVSKKTLSALHNLNHLAPKFAHVVAEDGTLYEKSVREIEIGTLLLIKNEEIIPLDGKIVKGSSSLNLVHLTGESLPVEKTVGDSVPAGGKNLGSALTIQVSRTSSDSTLARIIQLITEAKEAKPRLQQFLDRFGKRYATSIIALTFIFALSLPWILNTSYFGMEGSVYRSLAFLIAASPCALIIATPTAYLSTISACARRGILLKGGITLDALASCSIIAFDKTGTLTTGQLICTSIEPLEPLGKRSVEEALSIAYGLERQVVHPIATAICNLAVEKKCRPAEISDFKATPGLGLEGNLDRNTRAAIGLPEHIAAHIKSRGQEEDTMTAMLDVDGEIFLFRFTDQIRDAAKGLFQQMKERNQLRSIMLTGDHEKSARKIAHLLGIDEVFFDLRPEDKLQKVAELAQLGALAMVGDGINDAPALARASVGISMGQIGSAAAVDASDVVLLNDDLGRLSWLFTKAHQTLRIVKQNVTLALSVICLVTLPALLGFIPLWLAVLLHEGGTVLVGLNSLRLLSDTERNK